MACITEKHIHIQLLFSPETYEERAAGARHVPVRVHPARPAGVWAPGTPPVRRTRTVPLTQRTRQAVHGKALQRLRFTR